MTLVEAIILIVLIGAVARVLQARYQAHGGGAPRDDAAVAHARDEVRQLKERIQVLERVITDNHGREDLDRQIERLRDGQGGPR